MREKHGKHSKRRLQAQTRMVYTFLHLPLVVTQDRDLCDHGKKWCVVQPGVGLFPCAPMKYTLNVASIGLIPCTPMKCTLKCGIGLNTCKCCSKLAP